MKLNLFIIALFILLGNIGRVNAQNNIRSQDSLVQYYSFLVKSGNASDKIKLEGELYRLLSSHHEKNWEMARNFFYEIDKKNVTDSINKAMIIRFPSGAASRDEKARAIYEVSDAVLMEKMYDSLVKQFPPSTFEKNDRITYDYVRNAVSEAYANAGNVKKAVDFSNKIETEVWKGEGWAQTAMVLKRKGYLNEAEDLFKKARDNSYKFKTTHKNEYGADFAAAAFGTYSASLAEVYIEQKKFKEALPIIQVAHDSAKTIVGNINEIYSNALIALGKDQQGFKIIEEAVEAGQANAAMKGNLKKLYIKTRGNEIGFDEYLRTVNNKLAAKIKEDLRKQLVNEPAPAFKLTDLDGNIVSLENCKGKTIVLDFWATWCGPCKRSFPAMKMAQDRFSNNPNVRFLFVHTWEQSTNPTELAKKFINENKYPFTVLMDLKNTNGKNEVVESYKVTSIPTKFIIDGNGNIRFKFSGFSGGEDAAVEEIVAMIELASAGSSTSQK